MPGVSSTISLNDGVTSVVNNMNSALQRLNGTLGIVSGSLSQSFNTGALSAVNNHIQQAIQSTNRWNRISSTSVIQDTGAERLRRESASMTSMLNGITAVQERLKMQAGQTNILPPQAVADLGHAQKRLSSITEMIRNISNQDMSILDTNQVNIMNSALENMRQKERELIQSMSSMNENMKMGNVSGVNGRHAEICSAASASRNSCKVDK